MKKIAVVLLLLAGAFWVYSSNLKEGKTDDAKVDLEQLTVQSFKEKVFDYEKNKDWKFEGNIPVIIDFYADWCAPCRMVHPTLVQLQKEYDGKIKIYKINTDKEKELAGLFGIRGIPAFLFVPLEGKPQMTTGALPKETFEGYIKDVLKVSK